MQLTGLYIHVPFCKQACSYCNFHFSTQLKNMDNLVEALKRELKQRSTIDYIGSIYFGGGTPSLLKENHWIDLINSINENFPNQNVDEFTIEVNPEDITEINLELWKTIGVNRLSIGVQSLLDTELIWMNRIHNSNQAMESIQLAQKTGFDNISIDLIFGGPLKSDEQWKNELNWAFQQNVQHISAYALTVEPKTRLEFEILQGKSPQLQDAKMVSQFNILQSEMVNQGWDTYEISNYSITGFNAIHNSRYWEGLPYIGIGPGAHSFNGRNSRRWNIANNARYIQFTKNGHSYWENEELTPNNIINEYIMTSLRTSKGISIEKIISINSSWIEINKNSLQHFENKGLLNSLNGLIQLSSEGKLLSDHIISELMIVG